MTYSLTWLPAALRAAGLTVVEIPGWQTRGHGDVGKIQMVICHHTAEPIDSNLQPELGILLKGRPDLAGPLCNLGLGQDGKFYMIAAGKAWHAGKGLWRGVSDGNGHGIGIEAENNGINEAWPEIQMQSYAKGCAAIAKHCGFGPEMIAGHKEYALPKGRKADPNFDMNAFRVRVGKYLKPAPVGNRSTLGELKMAIVPSKSMLDKGSIIGIATGFGAILPQIYSTFGTYGIAAAAAFAVCFVIQALLPVGTAKAIEDAAINLGPIAGEIDPALAPMIAQIIAGIKAEQAATGNGAG